MDIESESITATNDGVIVGVEPAQPRAATPEPTLPPAPPAPDARFTAADIEKAREQEKSKVYSRIEDLQSKVSALTADLESRQAAEAEAQRVAEESERLRRESEMDVRDLLAQKEQEWSDRFRALEEEKERERVLREKEAQFHAFEQYKQQAVAAAAEDILPELLDFVSGDTPEEIASSIAGLRDRSAQIMNNTTEALAANRRDQRGVQPTGLPVAGPLDNETAHQTLTPEQIAGMSMSDFKKYRSQVGIGRSSTGRGLFS